MEVYVLRDGEKEGPLQLFQMRGMLRRGELTGDDLAWMRGMEGWVPIREIEALSGLVESEEEEEEAEPPPLPDGVVDGQVLVVRPWVRFWARMVDWHLFGLLLTLVVVAGGGLDSALTPVGQMMVAFGWGLIEAVLLSQWGTTPGKALLGVQVERIADGGGRPTSGQAVKRSLLLVVFGFGLGMPILMIMAWVISFVRVRQTGRTLWDEQTGLCVRHGEVTPRMAVIAGAVLLVSIAVTLWLSWDDLVEMMRQVQAQVEAKGKEGA